MASNVDVAVIGAGVSGMATGLRLQQAGLPFTIFEKALEVGGTWRENRYPGLTIDVPSPLYTFRDHRHPGWSRWMPGWQEILDYHRNVSAATGLREHIRFGAEVVAATWSGTVWDLELADGEHHQAQALVCAAGFLHHPRFPEIEGLQTFAGQTAHSAQWRDDIAVAGRRVGVIGAGSTGVQLVAALGGVASHVTLFQRTAQWIFPFPDFAIPRPVRGLLARRPRLIDGAAEAVEWLADRVLGGAATAPGLRRRLLNGVARAHLRTVRDPALRAKLTPAEAPLCRRPVVSTRFYRTVQRSDVAVETAAIERVAPEGVVTADGRLHELDVLILATGFRAHAYMRPIVITGFGGVTLDEAWAADGPHGYNTVALSGFPNLFMVMGPHSPLVSISIHGSAELQAGYIVQCLEAVMADDELVALAPTVDATRRWLDHVRAGMPATVWATGCNSWYVGDGATPVLWPYDRKGWRALLAHPDLADFERYTNRADRVSVAGVSGG